MKMRETRMRMIRASPIVGVYHVCAKKTPANLECGEVQIDAPTDAATGAVRKSAGQKCYLRRYIYRGGKSAWQQNKVNTCTNNYPFLQSQNLELLLEVNMASRAKSGSSALQIAFTAPKFRASIRDALRSSNT
jgi:hypothetical protein